MPSLHHKKECILHAEEAFTWRVGQALFEKPAVSFWMILIPILLLYFIHLMQQYKLGIRKFEDQFMITRRSALNLATEALAGGIAPRIEVQVQSVGLAPALIPPYRAWLEALVRYYTTLLSADGDSFEALVRSAFTGRPAFRQAMDGLSAVEKAFHTALNPRMSENTDAAEIVATIESQSLSLRRELVNAIFPY
jgi:hypothetical protein